MQTDIAQLSTHYPHLSEAFAHIPQGEAHLRRLQDLNKTWRGMIGAGQSRSYAEVVTSAKQGGEEITNTDTFDIIYAGGGLNLLNAAVMTVRYGMRVLIFDRYTVGAVHREWNISRDELQELLNVGLLTQEELESVIQREYSDGLVRFSAKNINVPAAELHLKHVLDIAVDADKLTSLCIQKIRGQTNIGKLPNVILHNTTFTRCTVTPNSALVDVVDQSDTPHTYKARLLIDGMGSTSPIACQLNCGRPFSLVCPTVGTVAYGYKNGPADGEVDPGVGEVLVSTEDARDGRQLIWETFPGTGDNVAIYLFYYAESSDNVDLLQLFDDFFALLPGYKNTDDVQIVKPVYGFIPAGYNITPPWRREQKTLAYDRVLSLGDAAAFQSPLTFCGFGSYVRNVRRITTLLHLALQRNALRAEDLNRIRSSEAVPAVARAFSKFMIARPANVEPTYQVNETMNVFCHILEQLGQRVTNAFFKDRISWLDYTRLVLRTPGYYRKIYSLALKTLTPVEILGWMSAWLKFGWQAAQFMLYRSLRPIMYSLVGKWLSYPLSRMVPETMFRLAIWREGMEQVARNRVVQ